LPANNRKHSHTLQLSLKTNRKSIFELIIWPFRSCAEPKAKSLAGFVGGGREFEDWVKKCHKIGQLNGARETRKHLFKIVYLLVVAGLRFVRFGCNGILHFNGPQYNSTSRILRPSPVIKSRSTNLFLVPVLLSSSAAWEVFICRLQPHTTPPDFQFQIAILSSKLLRPNPLVKLLALFTASSLHDWLKNRFSLFGFGQTQFFTQQLGPSSNPLPSHPSSPAQLILKQEKL